MPENALWRSPISDGALNAGTAIGALVAAFLTASLAHAQTATPLTAIQPAAAAIQPLRLSAPPKPLAPPNDSTKALVDAVLPATEVDHSFASAGLVGSAGFLCGLHPSPDNNGASTAVGYDPTGRFVGARLSYAF